MKELLIVLSITLLTSCSMFPQVQRGGETTVTTYKDGNIVHVITAEQPDNAKSAAQIIIDGQSIATTTGISNFLDGGDIGISKLVIMGGIVMFLGVLIIMFNSFVPMLSRKHGLIMFGGGFAISASGTMLNDYTWVIGLVGGIALAGGALYWLYRLNLDNKYTRQTTQGIKRLKKEQPEAYKKLAVELNREQDDNIKRYVKEGESK